MVGKAFRFLFRYKWRLLAVLLLLVAAATPIAYHYACQIARQKLIEEIARIHRDKIEVGSTSLGWNRLRAESISFESDDPKIGKWCQARELEVHLNLLSAIFSSDPEIELVVIQQPQIEISLDEQGNVLNDFVASDREPSHVILRIEDGSCLIRQPGRKTLASSGINLTIRSGPSQTEVDGTIDHVLDSKIQFSASTQQGRTTTHFEFQNFSADSKELEQLPLLDSARFAGFECLGRLDGKLELTFEQGEMIDFRSEIEPNIQSFKIDQFGDTFKNIDSGSLVLSPDTLELKHLKVECMEGVTTYSGKLRNQNEEWSGELEVQAREIALERLVEVLDLGFDMRGPTSFGGKIKLLANRRKFVIDGSVKGQANDFSIITLPSKNVKAELIFDQFTSHFEPDVEHPATTGNLYVNCQNKTQNIGNTIAALGKYFQIPVPTVRGQGTVDVQVTVPMDPRNRKEAYWAQIEVDSSDINIAEIQFDKFDADMTLFPNRYEIEFANLNSTKREDATFAGTIHFSEPELVRFELHDSSFDASLLTNYFNSPNTAVQGKIKASGELLAKPVNGTIQTSAEGWTCSDSLDINGETAKNLCSPFRYVDNRLYFSAFSGRYRGGNGAAVAELDIDARVLRAELQLNQHDFRLPSEQIANEQMRREIGQASFDTAIALDLDLKNTSRFLVEGITEATHEASPNGSLGKTTAQFSIHENEIVVSKIQTTAAFQIGQDIKLPKLDFAGSCYGDFTAGKLQSFLVAVPIGETSAQARPTEFELSFADSVVTAKSRSLQNSPISFELVYPVSKPAEANGKGKLVGVDYAKLATKLSWNEQGPIRFSGTGNVQFEFDNLSSLEDFHTKVNLSGLTIETNQWKAENVIGDCEVEGKQAAAHLSSKLFGGEVLFDAIVPLDQWNQTTFEIPARLRIQNGKLGDLARVFGKSFSRQNPTGRFQVDTNVILLPNALSETKADGQFEIRNFRTRQHEISESIKADFRVNNSKMTIRELNAKLGSGKISGRIDWPFAASNRGSLDLNASKVDLQRVSSFLSKLPSEIDGKISGRIGGTIYRKGSMIRMAGEGTVDVQEGNWHDVDWNIDRSRISWSFNPIYQQGQVRAQSAKLKLLKGSVDSKTVFSWGERTRFEVRGNVKNIDPREMANGSLARQVIGKQGTLSGKLDLSATNFRGPKDLKGSFLGTMNQARALQLPVLNSVSPFVNRSQFANRKFNDGLIKLDLRNSNIKVHQVAFADDLVQVLMDGNMRLNGRLDLAAIVHVGQNNNDPIRTILKSPLLASSSPPIALIAQFDRLISDRLLFFKISGTFERPRVQIETTKILRQESLKFILEKTYNLGGRPNSLLNRSTIRLR